jgi:uncharacterized protein YecE (DUF72 family)
MSGQRQCFKKGFRAPTVGSDRKANRSKALARDHASSRVFILDQYNADDGRAHDARRATSRRPTADGPAMTRVLVGTASWTDKSLIGSRKFYPAKCTTAEDRLRFYASQFPIVEIDSSYYAMPAPQVAQLWAERTPPDFTFNVKAFRLFTGHQTAPAALPKDIAEALRPIASKHVYYKDMPSELLTEMWKRFREGIAPLRHAGKLAAVHFQFAPWVAFHPQNRAHIDACMRELEGYRLGIEFRNKTWFEGRHAAITLDYERERGLVNVIVDEPQGMANCIPAVWEVTTPALSIVRLHGRNHETWNKKGLSSSAHRFNYDYSHDELADLAKKIGAISAQSTHVVFNNNYEDQGQRNARTLTGFLSGAEAMP